MSMMKIFDISGSAVSSQSQRLNVVASNLANVDTVAGPDGKAYKAREVTFQTGLMGPTATRRRPASTSAASPRTSRPAAACTTRVRRAPTPTATSRTPT